MASPLKHDTIVLKTTAPYLRWSPRLESYDVAFMTGSSLQRQPCHKDNGSGLKVASPLECDTFVLKTTALGLRTTSPVSRYGTCIEDSAGLKPMLLAGKQLLLPRNDGLDLEKTGLPQRQRPANGVTCPL
jgi:hypothetical protein